MTAGIILGASRLVAETSVTAAPATNVMDLSLDQLLQVNVDKVYGACKYEQIVSRAPSSVSIITRDEIQKQGYRTLADALRSVNGIFVTDDRNYSYVGIRGFNRPGDYNSRLLLLVDGHRLNDNVFEQGLYGTEGFLNVDAIERVEVVRGPSSSIYGNNAFFGVVNVITRRGASVNGWEATAEAGGNDTYKTGVTFGKMFQNGVELFLSGSIYDSAGEGRIQFDAPTNNNGVAVDSDGDRAYNFFGSLGYAELTLSGGWSWRQKTVPTASFLTEFNDGGERTTDEHAYVDLKYEHDFSQDVRLITRAAYDRTVYKGEYPYGTSPARVLNLDSSFGEWFSADAQLNWLVAERHTFIVGVDSRENLSRDQYNADVDPAAIHLDDHRQGYNVGFYAQAEVSLLTNLIVNAGGRFDYYDEFGGRESPRLGLIYSPVQGTTLKALYGEAFRAPNAYELYYSYPGQAKANPNLQPESIRTYELVWEQQLPAHLRFTASGYYYQVRNLISQVFDPSDSLNVFQNVDRVRAKGLELELEERCPGGVVARVSYALQRTEDEVTGAELSNSPEHIGKFNLTLPLWDDKLSAGLDLQYYSGVRTVMGSRTTGSFLANLTLFSRPIGKNLEVSASLYDLLDERQGFSASTEHMQDTIPLPGRSFRVKLTYRF